MADGGGLENRYGATHRGFESHALRSAGAFFLMASTWLKVPLDMDYFAEAARWIPWVGVQRWLDRTAGHRIPAPEVESIKA